MATLKDRIDGFMNVFTKRGTTKDRNIYTKFVWEGLFPDKTNLDIYNGDGIGAEIVDAYAEDMTRRWISINDDEDQEILKAMASIDTQKKFKRAITWAYATGAGVIYIGADDGSDDPAMPLNEKQLKAIKFLKVFNKSQVWKDTTRRNTDPYDKNFGDCDYYTLTPANGTSFEVHRSRIIEIDGIETDGDTWAANGDFNISIYQRVFSRLAGLNDGYAAASDTLQEYVITVLKMAGLFQHMKTPGGENQVVNRLDLLSMSKHSLNAYAVDADAGEEIQRLSTSLSGVPDTIEKLEDAVSVASGVPPIKLYNRPSKGLSGNNNNELRLWYDKVESLQVEKILRGIEYISYLIQVSSEGPTGGVYDESKTVSFNGLWQETSEEKAKNYKTTAEGDGLYIDRGVLEPDEVARSRFENNPEITLSEDHFEEDLNAEED